MHIGGIEHEVREIRSELSRKADQHEIHTLRSRVESLERTVAGLCDRMSSVEQGEVAQY